MKHSPPLRSSTTPATSAISLVVVIAFFCATSGCSDATGPTPAPQQHIVRRLATLAPELHDAADFFTRGVDDLRLQRQMETAIDRLADQLAEGRVDSSSVALSQARSVLGEANDGSAIDVAPISLALDYIERRINEILNEGAADSIVGVNGDVPPQN